jgi:hypothetical protein
VVDTEKEYSFVLTHEQTVKPVQKSKTGGKKKNKLAKTKNKSKSKVNTEQQKPGRPKGSKNKQNVKKKGLLYESFESLLTLVVPLLHVLLPNLKYIMD